MSSNKKSVGSIILLLLIFLLIAGLSWFFFKGDKPSKGSLADKISQSINSGDDVNEQAVGIDDINAARSAHEGHGHNAQADGDMIGIKGTVTKLDQPALYGTRGVGDPNAPVKIQEFFSLTCNHCSEFHKGAYQDLKKQFIDTGKVYFVYEEFPLNGPALYGSMIARCMPEERYASFVNILLRQQDDWAFGGDFKSALLKHAKLAGMTEEQFDTCFANKDLQKAVATNIKNATDAWKINSTPSFVVNDGERILYGGQTIETFQKLYHQLTGETVDGSAVSVEGHDTENSLMDLKDKTVTTIETLEEDVGKPILDFNSAASDKLNSAVKKSVTAVGEVKDVASEQIDNVMENKSVNKVMDTVGGAVDSAVEGMENAADKALDKTNQMIDAAGEQ